MDNLGELRQDGDCNGHKKNKEMRMNKSVELVFLKDADIYGSKQYEMLIKQYEMLAQSVTSSEDAREKSNSFWITINTLILSGTAYIRDAGGITENHKYFLVGTLISLGITSCFIWISYLNTLRKNVTIKNNLLIDIEKYFPIEIFTVLLNQSKRVKGKNSLTNRILAVPLLFVLGYLLFLALLLFFPYEIATH